MTDVHRLVDKLWCCCSLLRDDVERDVVGDPGGTIEYTEQLTHVLFLEAVVFALGALRDF